MTAEFLTHLTIAGDRWDLLAWDYYADPHQYERIQRANPAAPRTPVLPGGLRLLIPVIEVATTPDSLPPWKRT